MNDIDDALRRLSDTPAPERLASIEIRVLEAVAGHRFGRRRDGTIMAAMLGIGALTIGVGVGATASQANASLAIGPLGGAPELAPSTLLAGR